MAQSILIVSLWALIILGMIMILLMITMFFSPKLYIPYADTNNDILLIYGVITIESKTNNLKCLSDHTNFRDVCQSFLKLIDKERDSMESDQERALLIIGENVTNLHTIIQKLMPQCSITDEQQIIPKITKQFKLDTMSTLDIIEFMVDIAVLDCIVYIAIDKETEQITPIYFTDICIMHYNYKKKSFFGSRYSSYTWMSLDVYKTTKFGDRQKYDVHLIEKNEKLVEFWFNYFMTFHRHGNTAHHEGYAVVEMLKYLKRIYKYNINFNAIKQQIIDTMTPTFSPDIAKMIYSYLEDDLNLLLV